MPTGLMTMIFPIVLKKLKKEHSNVLRIHSLEKRLSFQDHEPPGTFFF